MDEINNNLDNADETPIVGNNRSIGDIAVRFAFGVFPLIAFGVVGQAYQLFHAPFEGQLPLGFGFTLETPWSTPTEFYKVGDPRLSSDMQWRPMNRGQRGAPGIPVRSHTTGFIDYGVRQDDPFAVMAEEFVHPGRVADIRRELVGHAPIRTSEVQPSVVLPASNKGAIRGRIHFVGRLSSSLQRRVLRGSE